MATHQRKCILQETLIPSPRSWDSLTFHSHTVIRYQLSVQGGRLRDCSPARGDAQRGGGGAGRALKTQGLLPAVGREARLPQSPSSGGAPAHLETPPARGPAHSTRTCCARAPACPRVSPLLAPPPHSRSTCPAPAPPSRDAAHLSFVRGGTIRSGQLSFRERPLCARRSAKPDLFNSHRPSAVGASAVPRPRRSGVWPFAQGHADLNPHPGARLTTKLQRLPIASASVMAPGGALPIAQGDKTITLVAGICGALYVCQAFTASFHFPSSSRRFSTPSYR